VKQPVLLSPDPHVHFEVSLKIQLKADNP
jgi:hypothetical protein